MGLYFLIFELIKHAILLLVSIYLLSIYTVHLEHQSSIKKVDKSHEFFTAHPFYNNGNKEENRIELSFVVPCYKEKLRLPKMLDTTFNHLKTKLPELDVEFILVNDGSPDDTWKVIKNIIEEKNEYKMMGVTYKDNSGKGYAVRTGMKYASGNYILMLDADGATNVDEIKPFLEKLKYIASTKGDKALAIGSRNINKNLSKRPLYRRIPSIVNNFIVKNLVGVKNIEDTQCGFKMFTKNAAKYLFSKMHLNRWAFDVELLYLAQKNNYHIEEIPVEWKEIDGGNLFVFQATLSFLRDFFSLIFYYNTGFWNIA